MNLAGRRFHDDLLLGTVRHVETQLMSRSGSDAENCTVPSRVDRTMKMAADDPLDVRISSDNRTHLRRTRIEPVPVHGADPAHDGWMVHEDQGGVVRLLGKAIVKPLQAFRA